MTSLADLLTCLAPYACAVLIALGGFLLAGEGSVATLAMATVTALVGAFAMAFAVSFAAPGPPVLGVCSPLTLGACLFGAIAGAGTAYYARTQASRGLDATGAD